MNIIHIIFFRIIEFFYLALSLKANEFLIINNNFKKTTLKKINIFNYL